MKNGNFILGKSDYDLYDKNLADEVCKVDREIIDKGKPYQFEEEGLDKNGKKAIYFSIKAPLLNQGELVALIGISMNITERKQAEVAKQIFIENARHDIRTPLAGIIGCANLLKSEGDPEKREKYTDDLIYAGESLLKFQNKILEAVQVANGGAIFIKKKFNIIKEMELIIDLNRPLTNKKGLKLTLKYDKAIPSYFIGNPLRVQRIVLELVTNALKFTEQGKVTLSIQLERKNSKESLIKISVNDTGIGLPKDKKKDIFCRFNRLIPSYKGIYKGAGLGLSIVKQFVDDMRGDIFVDSKEGEGTTLGCLLPFQNPLIMNSASIVDSLPIIRHSKV